MLHLSCLNDISFEILGEMNQTENRHRNMLGGKSELNPQGSVEI